MSTSPLFTSPFTTAATSDGTYGNSYGTPEITSGVYHRRGENDAFTTISPQFPPLSANAAQSGIPQRRRRRLRQHNVGAGCVQTAMRFILLSPLIVLVVWSAAAVLFTKNRTQTDQQQTSHQRKQQSSNNNHSQLRAPDGLLEVMEVFEAALGTPQQQQQQRNRRRWLPFGSASSSRQSSSQKRLVMSSAAGLPLSSGGHVIPVYGANLPQTYGVTSNLNGQQQLLPPSQTTEEYAEQQHRQQQISDFNPLQQQQGYALQQQDPLSSSQQDYSSSDSASSSTNSAAQPKNLVLLPPPPAGQSIDLATIVRPQSVPKKQINIANEAVSTSMMSAQGSTSKGHLIVVQPATLSTSEPQQLQVTAENALVQPPIITTGQEEEPLLGKSLETPLMQNIEPRTTVYFYRPSDVLGSNGQLVLPSFVYDAAGRAIPTSALTHAQLFLEPPRGAAADFRHGQHHLHDLNKRSTPAQQSVSEETLLVSKSSQPLQSTSLSSGKIKRFATVATDQSILVGTVGVLALILGALSARKLRHPGSWLSVCMENETLEHDAAYDTAFTIDHDHDIGGNNHYHTFGWKEDLEKFDV